MCNAYRYWSEENHAREKPITTTTTTANVTTTTTTLYYIIYIQCFSARYNKEAFTFAAGKLLVQLYGTGLNFGELVLRFVVCAFTFFVVAFYFKC